MQIARPNGSGGITICIVELRILQSVAPRRAANRQRSLMAAGMARLMLGSGRMQDAVFLLTTLGFFLVALIYVWGCAQL
jgi:hypothetical protein